MPGAFCNLQGVMLNLRDVAAAMFSFVIALHTFLRPGAEMASLGGRVQYVRHRKMDCSWTCMVFNYIYRDMWFIP